MTITPIESLKSIANLNDPSIISTSQSSGIPFQSLFQDAIQNVKDTDSTLNQELVKLTTGQSDNLHDAVIASSKASLSVQMLVQLRNKALDAYNEVMRMSV